MIHFKPINFKFRYKDGRELCFAGTCAYCFCKYELQRDEIADVFQMVNSRYTKISD